MIKLVINSPNDYVNSYAELVLEDLSRAPQKKHLRTLKILGTWIVITVGYECEDVNSLVNSKDKTFRPFMLTAYYLHSHPERYSQLFEDFQHLITHFYNQYWRVPLLSKDILENIDDLEYFSRDNKEELLFLVGVNLLIHNFIKRDRDYGP